MSWLTELREGVVKSMREDAGFFGGWVNSMTGRGDPSRDKQAANVWVPGAAMQVEQLRPLYRANGLARAVCNALPEWSQRNGWDLTVDGDAIRSREVQEGVSNRLAELGAAKKMLTADIWGQLFGGGLVLVGADDGRPTDQPLDEARIRSIRFLRVVGADEADIVAVYADPAGPDFGEPAVYAVQERPLLFTSGRSAWHSSRVIRFGGPLTDAETRLEKNGWDQSILDLVIAGISKHDAVWDNVGAMVEDGSQGVWKIQDLALAASNGMTQAIEARFTIADKARSMFRALILDAEKEDFSYVHRNFAGLPDLTAKSAERVAAIAQIPATVLMGQSPSGLNATGESDLELWYGRCRSHQSSALVERWERLVRLVMLASDGPTGGKEPDSWAVTMRDPRALTPMQRIELQARQAQIDATYIANKVVAPFEVAVNRFTAQGYSDTTAIDVEWRRQLLAYFREEIIRRADELFDDQLDRWLAAEPQGVQAGEKAEAEGGEGGANNRPGLPGPAGQQAPNNPQSGAVE